MEIEIVATDIEDQPSYMVLQFYRTQSQAMQTENEIFRRAQEVCKYKKGCYRRRTVMRTGGKTSGKRFQPCYNCYIVFHPEQRLIENFDRSVRAAADKKKANQIESRAIPKSEK